MTMDLYGNLTDQDPRDAAARLDERDVRSQLEARPRADHGGHRRTSGPGATKRTSLGCRRYDPHEPGQGC